MSNATLTKIAIVAVILQIVSYASSYAHCADTAHGLFF